MKTVQRVIIVLLCLVLVLPFALSLAACGEEGVEFTIYNCADYIDESNLDAFAEWYYERTGVQVSINYITYDTNETMMTKVINNDANVDVICSSEYAIQKLWNSGLLLPIAKTEQMDTINPAIYERTATQFGDEFADYFVPYMYGTLGVLYNADVFEEAGIDITEWGWSILWNAPKAEVLEAKVLMKDSIRDTFAAGVLYLKEQQLLPANYTDYSNEDLINCTDQVLVEAVKAVLIEQKSALKGYEVDFGKDDLIVGRAYADLAWSGDAMYAIEVADLNNVTLDYYVPQTGTNVWFDGWFIPQCTEHADIATAFIEFMCMPTVSAANMIEVGYSSAVRRDVLQNDEEVLALLADAEYDAEEFFSWEVRYPDIDNPDYGMMTDYGDANSRMTIMWEEVKAATADGSWPLWQLTLVILAAIVGVGLLSAGVVLLWRKLRFDRAYIAQ